MNTNVNLMEGNVIKIKSVITINANVSVKIQQKNVCAKKHYLWNPTTCSCENSKYLARNIVKSVITVIKLYEN